MLTLTYAGSVRVMPNYNVMGVAKAALEASVRYLADDYGPRGIRVNAHLGRPGAHACRRRHFRCAADVHLPAAAIRRCAAPSRSTMSAGSALYLLSDLSSGVTGEIHYVDSGYNIISMPTLDELKSTDQGRLSEPAA